MPDSTAIPRALVVEDDPPSLFLLARMLDLEGYDVTCCNDGLAAMELVTERGWTFDLALVDLVLPRMNGIELVQALRADPAARATPILCISAQVSDQVHRRALGAGADEFLRKPYRRRDLWNAIERAVASRREFGRAEGERARGTDEHHSGSR